MQTRSAFLKSSATKIGGLALLGSGVSLERTAAAFAAEDASSAPFTLSYGSGLAIGTVAANIDYLWATYAKKRNVKIDIQYYEPTVIRTDLAANKVNLVSFTPLTALALDDLGGNVKVICHTQPVSDYLIVANGDVIKTVKDVEGKRFGTSGAGTIASVVPQVAFTKLGVDWTKVQQVIIGNGTFGRLAAIVAGSVDAVAVYHDAGYTAVAQKPNLKILIDTADYAPSVFSSLMGSEQFLGDPKNHAGIVRALMARAEAERFIHQHPKAWIDIYMKHNKNATRSAIAKTVTAYIKNGTIDPDLKIPAQALTVTANTGVTLANPPLAPKLLPLGDWVDTSFRDEAIKKLGGVGWWKKR